MLYPYVHVCIKLIPVTPGCNIIALARLLLRVKLSKLSTTSWYVRQWVVCCILFLTVARGYVTVLDSLHVIGVGELSSVTVSQR